MSPRDRVARYIADHKGLRELLAALENGSVSLSVTTSEGECHSIGYDSDGSEFDLGRVRGALDVYDRESE